MTGEDTLQTRGFESQFRTHEAPNRSITPIPSSHAMCEPMMTRSPTPNPNNGESINPSTTSNAQTPAKRPPRRLAKAVDTSETNNAKIASTAAAACTAPAKVVTTPPGSVGASATTAIPPLHISRSHRRRRHSFHTAWSVNAEPKAIKSIDTVKTQPFGDNTYSLNVLTFRSYVGSSRWSSARPNTEAIRNTRDTITAKSCH